MAVTVLYWWCKGEKKAAGSKKQLWRMSDCKKSSRRQRGRPKRLACLPGKLNHRISTAWKTDLTRATLWVARNPVESKYRNQASYLNCLLHLASNFKCIFYIASNKLFQLFIFYTLQAIPNVYYFQLFHLHLRYLFQLFIWCLLCQLFLVPLGIQPTVLLYLYHNFYSPFDLVELGWVNYLPTLLLPGVQVEGNTGFG